jgi:hypothetical protein
METVPVQQLSKKRRQGMVRLGLERFGRFGRYGGDGRC